MRSYLRTLAGSVAVAVAVAAVGLLGVPAAASESPPTKAPEPQVAPGQELVEVPPTLDGAAAGGKWGAYAEVPARAPKPADSARRSAPSDTAQEVEDGSATPMGEVGPTSARLDVVVMGDGYTAGEQDDFEADAQARMDELLEIEPYASYRGLANFWLVHAVSTDSGISRDFDSNPGEVQDKDTALGAYFWCADTERLLCIDKPSVDAYAQLAPAADLVVVVGNSPRYGGAGYNHGENGDLEDEYEYSGISTLSSGHWASSLIAAHEVGHSLGNLADEYYYCTEPGYEAYCTYYGFNDGELYWGEVPEANVTIYGPGAGYGAGYLIENEYKWFRWLGETDPSGGTVGMYDGGRYYASGIYRPTQDSIMKSLANVNFNLPGTEAMVGGFYRYGAALTSEVPTGTRVSRRESLTVEVADLSGLADLGQLRWYVDGREAKQARGATTVIPQRLGVPASGRHTLSVVIEDETASIRDPQVRAATRTKLSWRVTR